MNIIKQNILDIKQGVIAHQVNCIPVMGAGLAKQIALKWPFAEQEYMCYQPQLGQCLLSNVDTALFVAHLYGQKGVGVNQRQTDYGALAEALGRLQHVTRKSTLKIYVPFKMGCGLAGGDWNVVSELIEYYLPDAIVCKL